ncbi:MAG: FAD:protein FMN transferase [Saprospiraceae bacterium]
MASQIGYPSSSMFKRRIFHLETPLDVTIVPEKTEQVEYLFEEANKEIQRLEKLFSTLEENNPIHQINKMAGIKPVIVDLEIFQLIERFFKVSSLTQRAFDISVGSFHNKMSSINKITQLVARKLNSTSRFHNLRALVLNQEDHSIFLTKPGMRMELDGIISCYAIECIKRKLIESGVNSGVIITTGDLCTWGYSPCSKPWTLSIADPANGLNMFSEIEISNKTITTVWGAEKIVHLNNVRDNSCDMNSLIRNPMNSISSVTIISSDTERGHTVATAVMTHEIKKGLGMINQMNDIDCIIVDEHRIIFTSDNIRLK